MVRMKQIWEVIPLPAKLKLVWSRLTSSRVITLYFVLSIVHCFIQVVFQLTAYSINFKATDFLSQLQITAGLNTKNFTLLSPDRKTLQSCWAIPGDKVERPCKILWAAGGMFEDGLSPDDFGVLKPKDRDILPLNPAPASSVVSVPTTTAVTSTRVPLSSITSSVTQSASIPVGSQIPGEEESDDDDDAASDTDSVDSDDDGFESDDSDDEGVTAGVTTSGIVPSSTIRPTSTVVVTRTVIGGSTATVRRVKRSSPSHSLAKRDVFITPITARTESDPNNFTITALQIIGLGEDPTATGDGHSLEGHQGDAVQVSAECVAVLSWPLQTLRNTKREDVVFIGFQVWVFGMSIVALLNESIPHIIAALFTHVLATMWSGFQLAHTANFRRNFAALTTNGACRGVNLLPGYWKDRATAEIPVLVLNCVALIASGILSWRLVKLFGWATFKRVGASLKINRIYKIVLTMSIVLQLSLFFLITALALWLDQLYTGSIGVFAQHGTAYRAVAIILIILLVPWICLGWFGVRKEHNGLTYGFLGLSILVLTQWGASFASHTWRLTFSTWTFFAIMAVVAAALTLLAFILGAVCQRNFGEQLSKYLQSQEPLEGEDFQRVAVWDEEKRVSRSDTVTSRDAPVAFPSNSVPTYSELFGPRVAPPQIQPVPPAVTVHNEAPATLPPMPPILPSYTLSDNRQQARGQTHMVMESTSSLGSVVSQANSNAHSRVGGLPDRNNLRASNASSDSFWDNYSFTTTTASVSGNNNNNNNNNNTRGVAPQGAGSGKYIQNRWVID